MWGAMGSADLAAEVMGSYERTRQGGSARIALLLEHGWDLPDCSSSSSPQRPLNRAATKAAGAIGKLLFKALTRGRDLTDFRSQAATGFVDLAQRRYMLDFGSYAWLYADGAQRTGRSGRRLSNLSPHPEMEPTPLWLLDLLAGVTEATEVGWQEVYGTPCRQVSVTVDLARASAATPGGMATPKRARFEELLALPAEVWLDDTHVRRVRCVSEHTRKTVQFRELGLPLDHFDWTRLPTFRSPAEAAKVSARAARP